MLRSYGDSRQLLELAIESGNDSAVGPAGNRSDGGIDEAELRTPLAAKIFQRIEESIRAWKKIDLSSRQKRGGRGRRRRKISTNQKHGQEFYKHVLQQQCLSPFPRDNIGHDGRGRRVVNVAGVVVGDKKTGVENYHRSAITFRTGSC